MPVQSNNKHKSSHRVKPNFLGHKKTKLVLPSWLKFLIYIPFVFIGLFLLYVLVSPSKYWDGKTRLALAINTPEGNINVSVFDPQTNSISTVIVPENAELDVARQLGTWRTASIWKLGQNEKVGGRLISETITKSFKLPTESWADSGALGFSKSNTLSIWSATFGNYKTNLTIKDRIGIGLFSMNVKNSERQTIELSQTALLNRARLADGSLGYQVREAGSSRISAIFADAKISDENLSLVILYPSDRSATAQRLGEIVQVLGAKVTSLQVSEDVKMDCLISGKNTLTRKKIADVFGCKTEDKELDSTIEIKIGQEFAKRF